MRIIDVKQVLQFSERQYGRSSLKEKPYKTPTHSKPIVKTAVVKIFFLNVICNFQSKGNGITRIMKSDSTLKSPLACNATLSLRQEPVVSSLFQIFSRGLHSKIAKKNPNI